MHFLILSFYAMPCKPMHHYISDLFCTSKNACWINTRCCFVNTFPNLKRIIKLLIYSLSSFYCVLIFCLILSYWVSFSNLRWNKLQDVIPPEIGELKRLTHLWVISFFWRLFLLGILVVTPILLTVRRLLTDSSADIWASIISKGKSPRSLQIFLSFVTSIYMKIVLLAVFLQNWALCKTFGTCNISSSLCRSCSRETISLSQ